jgi:signal transduction histidine kinase
VTQAWLRTYTRNAEHYAVMREIGLRSYMCVPLATGGRVLGALTFLSAAPGRHYGPADVALAEEIGHHAALAIDNARLYREAQEAVAVRDHFLMAASHDLRTPLTVINGHAALMHRRLESGRVPDAVWLRTHVDAMSDAANRMASTVEEITDAAQLQMGRTLTLQLSTVDFGALVRSAIGVVAEANVRWRTGPLLVDAPDGVLVEGDRARLERVVQNVVGNAVKYSPPDAPVHVEVRAQAAQATMTVCDHGVGIPAAELPHIFTPFFRASTSASIGGTGIGLAGAKAIVEQHGGHIEVQSAVGEGTTVVVTLPNTGVQPSDAGQIIPT